MIWKRERYWSAVWAKRSRSWILVLQSDQGKDEKCDHRHSQDDDDEHREHQGPPVGIPRRVNHFSTGANIMAKNTERKMGPRTIEPNLSPASTTTMAGHHQNYCEERSVLSVRHRFVHPAAEHLEDRRGMGAAFDRFSWSGTSHCPRHAASLSPLYT